jgi:hypothetical protein
VQCTYAIKSCAPLGGNFSQVLGDFENDCVQSIWPQIDVKRCVKLLRWCENLRESADAAMLRR